MDKLDFSKSKLKFIQISDTHLYASPHLKMFGISNNDNFNQVIEHIKKHELANTDAVLLTGDLSQDESAESYRLIVDALSEFKKPVFWISGNHDNLELMKNEFRAAPFFHHQFLLASNYWHFIFLNTQGYGTRQGHITEQELKCMEEEIEQVKNTNKKIALIMHHHPISINTPFMDQYGLENYKDLWHRIINSPVQVIICGHVHGHYSLIHQKIQIECSPASCFQIKKGAKDLQIEASIGYKIHYFELTTYKSVPVIFKLINN